MATCCCRTTAIFISSARRATRTAAAGSTARRSARTFPIRHPIRPRQCPGISKRRAVTGSASSFRSAGRRSGSRFARPVDACDRIAGRHEIAARLPAEDYPREGNFRRSPRSTVFRRATVALVPEVRSAMLSASFAMLARPDARTGRSRIGLENAQAPGSASNK